MALRYFLFWLPMPFLGVLNGTVREFVIKDYVNDFTAHQLSAFTLIVLILAYGLFIRKKLALHTRSDAAYCSVTWVVLTLLFEFGFGYFVGHHSFQTMLLEYYIWEGKLWPVVIIFTGLVPFILRKLQMLVTAFILGLTGSLHCVGMCGPIALMIGGSKSLLLNRILYNLGRTITYTAMGMLVGLFGKIFQWGGVQGKISIALGLLTLLLLFLPTLQARLQPSLTPMMLKLKEIFAARLQSKRLVSSLTSGIVNGFLPCGLVYAALTIALVQPSLLESAGVMMLFGLGTIPMLLAAAYSWQTVKQWIPIASYKLQTAMLVIVAVVMIWRGLSVELNSGNNYRVTECNTHAYSEF